LAFRFCFCLKPAKAGNGNPATVTDSTEAWHVGDAAPGIADRVLARSRNEVCCYGDAASDTAACMSSKAQVEVSVVTHKAWHFKALDMMIAH
jgi:hypothetical protein